MVTGGLPGGYQAGTRSRTDYVAARQIVQVQPNSGDMQGIAGQRRVAMDVRGCRRSGTDEQRGGARRAPGGLAAEDEWWHGQRAGEPFRRARADGSSHLQTARQEGVGLPQRVHRSLAAQLGTPVVVPKY